MHPIAEIHARFQLTEPCDLIGHHPHKWNIPTQANSNDLLLLGKSLYLAHVKEGTR